MTPTATALLERLRSYRRHANTVATWAEATPDTRNSGQHWRNLLDDLLDDLPRDLEAIESEAIAGVDAETDRLERVLWWTP